MAMAIRRRLPALLSLAMFAVLAWAAWAPLTPGPNRDALFEIPNGTWARRMAGNKVDILPGEITLTLGLRDILLLRNSDSVPQQFGPVLIMPGQEFRLPFEQVSENSFDCTAHASGQMLIKVVAMPAPGWQRLRWRARDLAHLLHIV